MADETRIITQPEGDEFQVGLSGQTPDPDGCVRPIVHQARMLHEPAAGGKPFVHMVCWDRDAACAVEHSGEVVHVGDPERPVPLDMRHSTAEPVKMDMAVSPLEHDLGVKTALDRPIHHALQLKTPVQLRFVNPWKAESSYTLEVRLGNRNLMSVNLNGTTTLTPCPPPPDPCAEAAKKPGPTIRTMADISGRTNT